MPNHTLKSRKKRTSQLFGWDVKGWGPGWMDYADENGATYDGNEHPGPPFEIRLAARFPKGVRKATCVTFLAPPAKEEKKYKVHPRYE